jgi:hypothetical protein
MSAHMRTQVVKKEIVFQVQCKMLNVVVRNTITEGQVELNPNFM